VLADYEALAGAIAEIDTTAVLIRRDGPIDNHGVETGASTWAMMVAIAAASTQTAPGSTTLSPTTFRGRCLCFDSVRPQTANDEVGTEFGMLLRGHGPTGVYL
jgi:hypothetical protein